MASNSVSSPLQERIHRGGGHQNYLKRPLYWTEHTQKNRGRSQNIPRLHLVQLLDPPFSTPTYLTIFYDNHNTHNGYRVPRHVSPFQLTQAAIIQK